MTDEELDRVIEEHEHERVRGGNRPRLKKYLDKNEVVRWLGHNENRDGIKKSIQWLQGIFVFIVIILFLVFTQYGSEILTALLGGLVLAAVLFGIYYLKLNKKINEIYAITDKRIIVVSKLFMESIWSENFEDLKVRRDATNQMFDTFFFGRTSNKDEDERGSARARFSNVGKKKGTALMNLILKEIYKSKKYAPLYQKFQELKRNYKLSYDKVNPKYVFKDTSSAILQGEIEGMRVYIQVENFLPIRMLKIQFSCPNIENNAFRISPENLFKKMGKLGKLQDIIIGEEDLDKRFIFESDNVNFMKQVLNDQVLSLLKKENGQTIKNIEFADVLKLGIRKKITRIKPAVNDDPNVLDAHLLEEASIVHQEETNENNPNRTSLLAYEARVNNESETLAADLINLIDLMLALALSVKTYEGQ